MSGTRWNQTTQYKNVPHFNSFFIVVGIFSWFIAKHSLQSVYSSVILIWIGNLVGICEALKLKLQPLIRRTVYKDLSILLQWFYRSGNESQFSNRWTISSPAWSVLQRSPLQISVSPGPLKGQSTVLWLSPYCRVLLISIYVQNQESRFARIVTICATASQLNKHINLCTDHVRCSRHTSLNFM